MNVTSKEVVIRLKDTQIPQLLAAIRLGITLEHWCNESMYMTYGISDSMTPRWQGVVVGARDEIIRQTGIDKERYAYARSNELNALHEVLFKAFKRWQKKQLLLEAKDEEENARR